MDIQQERTIGYMKKMIWLDIDDTIALSWPVMVESGKCFCKRNQICYKVDLNVETEDDLYFADILHLSDKVLTDFFAECYPNYLMNICPMPGAREFIETMKNLKFKINLISARRDNTDGSIKCLTKIWLKKNRIPYDELIIHCKDKGTYLQGAQGFFIDDCYNNCISVKENTSLCVIQKKTPFSKEANALKADNWNDVIEYILSSSK